MNKFLFKVILVMYSEQEKEYEISKLIIDIFDLLSNIF